MKKIKAGIIGCGFIANGKHFPSMAKIEDVEPVAFCDIIIERAQASAKEYGGPDALVCEDYKEVLERDDIDVIHVCTPPYAHEPVSVAGLRRDKFVICEKPLTGYFGDGTEGFHGGQFPKQVALDAALESLDRILEAEHKSKGRLLYAENWVYMPSIQKEREILQKTGGQILWIHGEEAHSGSHSRDYAYWARCGGGVLIGKGCHPLTAALYLKRVEGRFRDGKPIRPKTVSARAHALTRMETFRDEGHIRCDYHDIDDFSIMHVEFEDGTLADVIASDIVLGGIHNWLEICANNHKAICNINPNTAMQTYNPVEANFKDIYVVEKIETKQGWACTSPDEDWFTGYPQEMEAFYRTIAYDEPLESDSLLAADTISTIYSAYLSAERQGASVEVRNY